MPLQINVSNAKRTEYSGMDRSAHDLWMLGAPDGRCVDEIQVRAGSGVLQPLRRSSWYSTAFIQLIDIIGSGVLTLGTALAQIGWLGVLIMICMLPLNIYAGLLLSAARNIYPCALSYGDMASFTFGKQFRRGVSFMVSAIIICGLGCYLEAAAMALDMIFSGAIEICRPYWCIIALGLILPLAQIQSLDGLRYLCILDAVLFLAAVFIPVLFMVCSFSQGENPAGIETHFVNPNMTWIDFFSGFSKITFSYIGAYIYLEMMAEMKVPEDFPKTFFISGPFQLLIYLSASCVSYAYKGAEIGDDLIISILPREGIMYKLSSIFLLVHMIMAYLVKGVIVTKTIYIKVFPKERGKLSKAKWFLCTVIVAILTFILSNAIPIFNDLVSLIGSTLVPWLGFLFPVLFLLKAKKNVGLTSSIFEVVCCSVLISIGIVLFFVGTAANSIKIVEGYSGGNVPFSCT